MVIFCFYLINMLLYLSVIYYKYHETKTNKKWVIIMT